MRYLKYFESDSGGAGGAGTATAGAGGSTQGAASTTSDGSGGMGGTGGTNMGSGDDGGGSSVSSHGGGVAYSHAGNIDGMGAIKNPTVSKQPGNALGTADFGDEAGSGDVGFPLFTYTKNSGATGNKKIKMGKISTNINDFLQSKNNSTKKVNKEEKEVNNKVNKVKDVNINNSKVLNYQQFMSFS